MTADDKDAVLAFAGSLPENDLLFLSFDITKESFVENWIRRIEAGNWHTILVEVGGKLVGHGSLMQTEQIWSRHLGEIILLLAPEVRGKGLGNILAGELFAKAEELKLQKVVARIFWRKLSAMAWVPMHFTLLHQPRMATARIVLCGPL